MINFWILILMTELLNDENQIKNIYFLFFFIFLLLFFFNFFWNYWLNLFFNFLLLNLYYPIPHLLRWYTLLPSLPSPPSTFKQHRSVFKTPLQQSNDLTNLPSLLWPVVPFRPRSSGLSLAPLHIELDSRHPLHSHNRIIHTIYYSG